MILTKEDYGCVGPGWRPILEALDSAVGNVLSRSKAPCQLKILQIKEKFGGLRFYYEPKGLSDLQNKEIWGIVSMAECMSFRMCEGCGRLDVEKRHQKNQKFGWIKTLCPKCHAFRDNGGRLWEEWKAE